MLQKKRLFHRFETQETGRFLAVHSPGFLLDAVYSHVAMEMEQLSLS